MELTTNISTKASLKYRLRGYINITNDKGGSVFLNIESIIFYSLKHWNYYIYMITYTFPFIGAVLNFYKNNKYI